MKKNGVAEAKKNALQAAKANPSVATAWARRFKGGGFYRGLRLQLHQVLSKTRRCNIVFPNGLHCKKSVLTFPHCVLTGTRHHGIIQPDRKYEGSTFSGFCASCAGRGAGKGGAKGQGEAAPRGHDNDAKESLDETQCKEHLMTQQQRLLPG